MLNVQKIFGFFSLMLLLGFTHYANAECGKNINKNIQKIIDDNRLKFKYPGIQVSINCSGEDIPRDFVSGTTTLNGSTPVKAENLFQIGSITKSFIATIILQLEAEGQLSIDDPIGHYLKNIPKSWQSVTIKQLLSNSSGLSDYLRVGNFWATLAFNQYKKQWSPDELLSYVVNNKALFPPGMGWGYSSTNYVLAGQLIEAVTGQLLDVVIDQRLAQPLHLSNTFYVPRAYDQPILNLITHGYSILGLFANEPKDITDFNNSWVNSAGAMISNTHDISIWLRQLLTTETILSEAQRNKLTSLIDMSTGKPLSKTSTNRGYGLGMMGSYNSLIGEYWGHDGVTLGYRSYMLWLKCNDLAIAVMINRLSKEDFTKKEGQLDAHRMQVLIDLISYIQATDPVKQCHSLAGSDKSTINQVMPLLDNLYQHMPVKQGGNSPGCG